MSEDKPELVAINHDDYHAKHIGRDANGRQFFLTTPFVPAIGGQQGGEFIALYLFDEAGVLIEAKLDELGPRSSLDKAKANQLYASRLAELGEVDFCRIEVQPFSVQRFGTTFGLVVRAPEEDDDEWAAELKPGNYMAFFEPWDSGDYDT